MSLVQEYMNGKIITRLSNASVLDISKAMSDWKISSIPITDEQSKRVIGIVTESDIVRGIANGVHPERIVADSIMSTPVFSITNDQPIEEAARLMIKNRVRHLLVEDSFHGVVGIITATDLARYLKQQLKNENAEGKSKSSDLLSEVWELFF